MVKRKEFRPPEEADKIRTGLDEEDEEIIELEEVVEEPDLLPVGEDLDELLKASEHEDFEFDIEKLDEELGGESVEEELEAKAEEVEDIDDLVKDLEELDEELGIEEDDLSPAESPAESVVSKYVESRSEPEKVAGKPVTPPSPSPASAQDAIDSLFQEALLEVEPADSGKTVEKLIEPVRAVVPEALPASGPVISREELDKAIEELETRIMSKFEAFVQNQLSLIVLEAVRDELRALLKQLEEQ